MEKIVRLFVALVFLCSGCVIAPVTPTVNIDDDVEVEADIPGVAVEAEPALTLMPETGVYFIPGISADIFFFDGWWWRNNQGFWYRSYIHSGGWVTWAAPPVILGIPLHDYRQRYYGHAFIPYREFRGRHPNYRPEMQRRPVRRVEKQRQEERRRIEKQPTHQQQQQRQQPKVEKPPQKQQPQQQKQQVIPQQQRQVPQQKQAPQQKREEKKKK